MDHNSHWTKEVLPYYTPFPKSSFKLGLNRIQIVALINDIKSTPFQSQFFLLPKPYTQTEGMHEQEGSASKKRIQNRHSFSGEIGHIEASFLFAGGPREKSGFEADWSSRPKIRYAPGECDWDFPAPANKIRKALEPAKGGLIQDNFIGVKD